MRGLQKLGFDTYDFIFIAIEKTPPFSVGVYRADREMINHAMQELDKLVPEIDNALQTNEFPDYTPEITSIGLPPWMIDKKEQPDYDPNLMRRYNFTNDFRNHNTISRRRIFYLQEHRFF